jgi:hypothetical protein
MTECAEFVLRVLEVTAEVECCEDVWWRTDGEYAPITFLVNCNDLFAWACADCVQLVPGNIDSLERAYKDVHEVDMLGEAWGALLFCCRERKMRPQKPYYKHIPENLWFLFDECGPEG